MDCSFKSYEDKKFLDEHPEIKQSQVWDKGIQLVRLEVDESKREERFNKDFKLILPDIIRFLDTLTYPENTGPTIYDSDKEIPPPDYKKLTFENAEFMTLTIIKLQGYGDKNELFEIFKDEAKRYLEKLGGKQEK